MITGLSFRQLLTAVNFQVWRVFPRSFMATRLALASVPSDLPARLKFYVSNRVAMGNSGIPLDIEALPKITVNFTNSLFQQ